MRARILTPMSHWQRVGSSLQLLLKLLVEECWLRGVEQLFCKIKPQNMFIILGMRAFSGYFAHHPSLDVSALPLARAFSLPPGKWERANRGRVLSLRRRPKQSRPPAARSFAPRPSDALLLFLIQFRNGNEGHHTAALSPF